ncbi:CST complex subunit CTC1-like isoform X1 [Montipora foliosa]|uniref:CST complex subunit CTC1-like isoform X1 n=2 Tax=Montipora foliosa TaxID=591990 RepID=UPI0035F1A9EF
MEVFLRRCKNEFCLGLVRNEKEWLRSFYYDVEKGLRQNESDAEFVEVCLHSLRQIKRAIMNELQAPTSSNWLPFDQKVIPLNTLLREHPSVFGGCIVSKASPVESFLGCNPVVKMPYILIGYLTFKPKSFMGSAVTGTLFVEDNLGAIACEIVNPVKQHVDKLVLIPEWNYVPSSFLTSFHQSKLSTCMDRSSNPKAVGSGYLEVIGECAPILVGSRNKHSEKPLDFFTIQDFQRDRSSISTCSWNICGSIFALSPVHSMSVGKPFFFIKLCSQDTNLTTVVVVQGEQLMVWHKFLQIDESYIFTKLRETTMNKGTRNERKILAATRHSDFQNYQSCLSLRVSRSEKRPCIEEKRESKRLKTDKEEDDLNQRDTVENLETVPLTREVCHKQDAITELKPKVPTNMSYTGVVTKCVKPEAGVYELDGKIRLYVNHQPCSNLARGLRVGAELTVHNVHLCRKGKRVLGLSCCTQSTVRIVKFSPLVSPWKPFSPCESPLALLGQNLTLADYVDLLEMCDKVLEKFSPLYRTSQLVAYSARKENRARNESSVLEQLLSYVKSQSSSSVVPSRNIYDEFFEVPHKCSPNQANELTFPSLPTMKEFLDAVQEKISNQPWLNGHSSQTTPPTDEKQDWMFKLINQDCFNPPLILVGSLRNSTKTGQLLLYDQTGDICCMVAPTDLHTQGHMCARECCKGLFPVGKASRCPCMQTWHLNALIQINKFEVVIEKFKPSNYFQENFATDTTRKYLQFSFDNVDILGPKDVDKRLDKRNSELKKEEGETSIRREGMDKELDNHTFMCKILFMVRNCEVPALRKVKDELCYPCGVEIKIVAVHRSEIQKGTGNSHCTTEENTSCCLTSGVFLSGFKLESKNAALKLVKRSLRWSRVLYPGCFFVITETVPNQASSRILKNGILDSLINVSSDMQLNRVCLCESCGHAGKSGDVENNKEIVQALNQLREDFFRNDSLCCVDTVLSDSSLQKETAAKQTRCAPTAQVSFQGVVVSRELRQSDIPSRQLPNGLVEVPKFGPIKATMVKDLQLGFALLTNNIIQLRVKDLQSPNSISVYLDLRRTNYICGLLPGATVQFRRFVRKFSRTRNMYCIFEACSSLVVERRAVPTFTRTPLNPGSSLTLTVSKVAEENTKKPPNRHLIELIKSEADGNFIQTISRVRCRVTVVQKASVRWLCKRCGELVTRNECTGGCYSAVGYKFNAEARCVVEDGTGEAQVYVYDDLVPTILKLSRQQWLNLQDLAMRNGELLYQRYWRGASSCLQIHQGYASSREADAKKTFENYCCSPQFQRLIVLQCKLFRSSKSVAVQKQQEYETRNINVGGTEHNTLVLPKLLLRAEAISDIRAVEEIRSLLQAVHTEKTL